MSTTATLDVPPTPNLPVLKRAKRARSQPKNNGHHKIDPNDPFLGIVYPDHTQLPCEDGTFVKNFQEHPQSIVLTSSLMPLLDKLHPDGQYAIGQDCGIYWRYTEPVLDGAESPDWFYVPNRPPTLNGAVRRSYVLWKEVIAPLLVIEFVSGDGAEERDRTPLTGKFWVYENGIRAPYYAIYEVRGKGKIELYRLREGRYELVAANDHKRYAIPQLGIELGLWQGAIQHMTLPWLRVWDSKGNLLLTSDERAEQEQHRAEQESQRAEQERQQAELERLAKEQALAQNDRLIAQLRKLGIEPEAS